MKAGSKRKVPFLQLLACGIASCISMKSYAEDSEAVMGLERELSEDGEVLNEYSFENSPPENLRELLEYGNATPDGVRFAPEAYSVERDGRRFAGARIVSYRPTDERATPRLEGIRSEYVEPVIPAIAEDLQQVLDSSNSSDYIPIHISVKGKVNLPPLPVSLPGDPMPTEEERLAWRTERVQMRRDQTQALQAALQERLLNLGGIELESFWISNGIALKLPVSAVAKLADDPDVRQVSLQSLDGTGAGPEVGWNGEHIRSSSGLNASVYLNGGYSGERTTGALAGLKLGIFDAKFDSTHTGFQDRAYNHSSPRNRVVQDWNCYVNPCTTSIGSQNATDAHGTTCAGLMAGDYTDHQISGKTAQWERENSGVATEGDFVFLRGSSNPTFNRAIQKAIDLDVDLLSVSRSFTDDSGGSCNYLAGSNIQDSVYNLVAEEGIPVFKSAGNVGNQTSCLLSTIADNPVVFTVAGLGTRAAFGNTQNYCETDYATCPIGVWYDVNDPTIPVYSARGGYDLTTVINGYTYTHTAAGTGIDVAAPACTTNGYTLNSSISTGVGCGTSYATPQVAGIGALYKSRWLQEVGNNWIDTEPGRLYTALLTMGDRQSSVSPTTYRASGYDPLYGAGRLRAYLKNDTSSDWVSIWYNMSDGDVAEYLVAGSGAEPNYIQQFKAAIMWFEDSHSDVADITMELWTDNCGDNAVLLGSDMSYDLKKMVRTGSAAAGQKLCIKLRAYHIPAGETRKVYIQTLWSADTAGL